MEIAHARAAQVKNNENSPSKRRKLDCEQLVNSTSQNLSQCSCSTTSLSSDKYPVNLEVENLKTNNSTFMNRELSFSDAMETTTKKTKSMKSKASSAQKPSMAEIEEFFSVAEKYEAKRFAEKYNFDIVKDVPLEGKYQWVRIKQ